MRLRWKLLVAMVALVVATLGVSGLFARQATHEQVRRLLIARPGPAFDHIVAPIEDHLRDEGWRGVEEVLDLLAATMHGGVVVTTPSGDLIAVS